MCSQHVNKKPGLLSSVFQNKCPRCREGKLFATRNPYQFKTFMRMPDTCPVCGQPFEPEIGFYYGTGFVSYALAVMICAASFLAWLVTIGMALDDNRIYWWIGTNAVLLIVLQPPLMRLSRTIWLWFFVRYDRNWRITQGEGLIK